MCRILTILVALITMGTAAHATILATGSLYGGITQNQATCYLFNAGNSSVSVSGAQIIREAFGPVTLAGNNCSTLAAGGICRFFATIVNGATHSCKVVVDPDGAQVRGELDIRGGSGSGTVLQVEQLR